MPVRLEDWIALGIFLICFYGYHALYFYFSRRFPQRTRKGRMLQAMRSSFEEVLHQGEPLLIVHQVRNALMTITFLAGASVLLLGALISLTGVIESLQTLATTRKLTDLAILLIIATLGVTFFSLLNSLRHFNLLTFLVSARPEKLREMEETDPAQYLTDTFMSASDAFTLGRRGFLYSVIAAGWLLNPWAFLALTLIVTIWLGIYDTIG